MAENEVTSLPDQLQMRYNGGMEIIPLTVESIIELLRHRAAEIRRPIVLKARIAISPNETRLLELSPERPLETIQF